MISSFEPVYPMRHIGGFAGADDPLPVRADGDALGFDADRNLFDSFALGDVDDGDEVVVLVGGIEKFAVWIHRKGFGVFVRGQLADGFQAGGIDDQDCVVIAGGDVKLLLILAQYDAAWTFADFDSFGEFAGVPVHHGQGVVLFQGDVEGVGLGGMNKTASQPQGEPKKFFLHACSSVKKL